MLLTLPKDPKVFLNWTWDDYQPFADRLLSRQLDAGNVDEWVNEWSDMAAAVEETYDRHYVATTVNTADKAAEQAFNNFLENLYPRWQETEQALREKLLQSGLEPANFSVPMRNFRAEADLFRAENLPLLTELEKLCSEYDRIVGAQTVEWQGVEATLTQLEPILQQQDRELGARSAGSGARLPPGAVAGRDGDPARAVPRRRRPAGLRRGNPGRGGGFHGAGHRAAGGRARSIAVSQRRASAWKGSPRQEDQPALIRQALLRGRPPHLNGDCRVSGLGILPICRGVAGS